MIGEAALFGYSLLMLREIFALQTCPALISGDRLRPCPKVRKRRLVQTLLQELGLSIGDNAPRCFLAVRANRKTLDFIQQGFSTGTSSLSTSSGHAEADN